jgi:hypothetical protein
MHGDTPKSRDARRGVVDWDEADFGVYMPQALIYMHT